MKESSFGFIKVFNHAGRRIEYLEFIREGRFHQHDCSEYFTVLSGQGELITEKGTIEIIEGETYTVPPSTSHRMRPSSDKLNIIVSYSSLAL